MHLLGNLASFAAFALFFFTPKAQRPHKKPKTYIKFLSTWRIAFF
jgi:hypothetical protein